MLDRKYFYILRVSVSQIIENTTLEYLCIFCTYSVNFAF